MDCLAWGCRHTWTYRQSDAIEKMHNTFGATLKKTCLLALSLTVGAQSLRFEFKFSFRAAAQWKVWKPKRKIPSQQWHGNVVGYICSINQAVVLNPVEQWLKIFARVFIRCPVPPPVEVRLLEALGFEWICQLDLFGLRKCTCFNFFLYLPANFFSSLPLAPLSLLYYAVETSHHPKLSPKP